MNKWSIDRFEGQVAVLVDENERSVNIHRCVLPDGVQEGSILAVENGAWILLPEETENRRRTLFSLQESLFDE